MVDPRRGARALLIAVGVAAACSPGGERRATRADSAIVSGTPATTTRAAPLLASSHDYVGLRYESLPKGFRYESGAVIPKGTDGVAGDFDFARVRTPRGEMVWFDTLGATTARGTPSRIVRAELRVPPLAADERLFMASCDVSGRVDGRVVAIAVNEANVARFTRVRQAWRIDPARARFELVPVAGMVCEEPGS